MSRTDPAGRIEEAARWYAELQDERAGPALWQAFEAWEADPANAEAFRQIEASLRALDRTGRPVAPPQDPVHGRRWGWAGAVAAALAVAALSFWVSGQSPDAPPAPPVQTYVTATGEQRLVTLDDGSTVHLNTGSQVDVSYTREARRVTLASGQAVFDVARGARPFTVQAGEAETRALGTTFEVYLRPGAVQVTLVEGVVSVRAGDADRGGVILSPGEQLSLADGSFHVRRIDPAAALSWQTGMVSFSDARLDEAAAEMNRYAAVKVKVDPSLAKAQLSGAFPVGDQRGFAEAVGLFLGAEVEEAGGEIRIRPGE